MACHRHRLSAGVYCIDALDVDIDPKASFEAPKWRSFDLLAGVLDENDDQPLRLVERIDLPDGDAQAFRAQMTRAGDKLILECRPGKHLRELALGGPRRGPTIPARDGR